MTGRTVAILLVGPAVLLGVLMYWLQVYAFYDEVGPEAAGGVTLVSRETGSPEPIDFTDFRAIDAQSSPIRFRACFRTPVPLDRLAARYLPAGRAIPRTGPAWFDCFDAEAIGAALERGEAVAFLGQRNVHPGVDRIVAILPDGRGYIWHDLNDCGRKAYDGTPIGPECPKPEGS